MPTFADAYRKKHRRPSDAPMYHCQCGCDLPIPWKPSHWRRHPKFIQAHYLRDGTSLRIQKLKEAHARARLQPPDGWIKPTGLCECGCGKATKTATFSRPERDEYIGHPRRWVQGHNGRAFLSARGSDHPQWKGGRCAVKGGYIRIHKPEHPTAQRDGYVLEHRYIYEVSRGVLLPKNISVHHINGDKSDNRPENLIATTRAQHVKVHIKAGQVISLFLDERLLELAKVYVRTHGELPDLESLTHDAYPKK